MFLEWTQAARQHSVFFHLRPIFHFFIKCYPLVLKPWLQDCFNPCKALLLLQKMILPYSHVWTLISVISLVLEHWTRPGSWPCWNLTFSVNGWVNFWLFCFPMLVDGAAIQMVVVGLKEESRIFFGAAVGLSHFTVFKECFSRECPGGQEKWAGFCLAGSWWVKKWRQ